jgi:Na+-translocating ferredoxin:NAD+ oxidoreductase RnfD subunit
VGFFIDCVKVIFLLRFVYLNTRRLASYNISVLYIDILVLSTLFFFVRMHHRVCASAPLTD